ncbi:C4-dicarboxylate ABC transporter permease [Pasteurellaceae bacterium HPA106]|uniref:tripartite tricarboxylate transporter permease n=1 Tax=Spirabiliibacterium pneumoniae TaxID=221400 RepID=UPI001AAD6822|nr:tripartite tricarboxylate transporter permease [Spirabiliibacterium pneumoniae]MBE2895920.1 C4-dicarboxylate ABC transporter permease [Spirabiliibacterium pneumoniae]
MENLELLLAGFYSLFTQPMAIFLGLMGVCIGLVLGVLPGLTATMGVAILLPFTFGMDSVSALLMISGVFFGGIYGGSITAVLLNIPGTPAAAATALDGYQLTRKGKAGLALGFATIGSVIGGIVSVLMLVFLAPLLAKFALEFSAPENFALAIFGLSIIISISGKSLLKGLITGFIGLLIATIGLDPMTGYPRFTFGNQELMIIPFIPVMIGLFAGSEAFKSISEPNEVERNHIQIPSVIPKLKEIKDQFLLMIRSGFIGSCIGSVPGAGADIAAFVSYNEAKRFSKHKAHFGTGRIEGVAAAEAGSNGCTGGAMLPMLSLGIPGDAVTAVMLGALTLQGLQPGPLLFKEHSGMVFTLFAGMFICYIALLVIGLSTLKYLVKVLSMPKSYLIPIILCLCLVGTFAINNSVFDISIMLTAGIVGYVLRMRDFPVSPIVLAMIMGPMAESNFRRALALHNGSVEFLYTRPITATLFSIAMLTIFFPVIKVIYNYLVSKFSVNKGV